MAKISKSEALDRWRDAEEKYRKAVEAYLDPKKPASVDKAAAMAITKARVKAEERRATYFDRCLR